MYTRKSWGTVVAPAIVVIPEYIEKVCHSIQRQVGKNEFSILLKGQWSSEGFIVHNEFFIPLQEVTISEVNFKEDLYPLVRKGWNVILHSHPFTTDAVFSTSDENTINKNFDCSILYCQNGFSEASLRFSVDDMLVIVKTKPKIVKDKVEVLLGNKIKVKEIRKYGFLDIKKQGDDDIDIEEFSL